jgi:hypothetical protein
MWIVDNRTPYAADRNWTRDRDGAHRWLVAVKATFEVELGGALRLADPQPPPQLAPEYHGEPSRSSLRVDSDLLAIRSATDVVLDAFAHAPGGRAAATVPVSIRVGDLSKAIVVYGERRFFFVPGIGLQVTTPQPFVSRPIRYESAFGGADLADADPRQHRLDPRNPIGAGFAVRPERLADRPAPSIEYPGGGTSRGPAGFGPIDAWWSPRRELAGTYDDRWTLTKKPLLPDDYDERFALSAPADQQVSPHLRGGESVELQNLTPEGGLRFEIPRIYLTFTTHVSGQREEHRARLATLFIEPEARRFALVWQTSLLVKPDDVDYLDRTVVEEKPYVR